MTRITTREHLLNILAEASELEHNLLCLYLYSVFSLKSSTEEDVSTTELDKIKSWKKVIREIAIQEMGHLALVSNITTAIGGLAHYHRPNFPVSAGYYPSEFVLHLAPFNMDTLEHFLFLERPADKKIQDNPEFREAEEDYKREAPKNRLMTYAGNYKTVGELYSAIRDGMTYLCEELGEDKLFCGSKNLQLSAEDIKLDGLSSINNLQEAVKAIDFIVEQGEGGEGDDCHFEKFATIKREYQEILRTNPDFSPARAVVKNPVMRKTSENDLSIWVSHDEASIYLDISNALYNLMLKLLIQVYAMEQRSKVFKKNLIDCAFIVMKIMGDVSTLLTHFPCKADESEKAGMSFTVERYLSPYELSSEKVMLKERVQEILDHMKDVQGLQRLLPQMNLLLEKLT